MVKCRLSPIGSKGGSFRDSYPSKRLKHRTAGSLEKGCFWLTGNAILVIRKKVANSFLMADCAVHSTEGKEVKIKSVCSSSATVTEWESAKQKELDTISLKLRAAFSAAL